MLYAGTNVARQRVTLRMAITLPFSRRYAMLHTHMDAY